EPSWRSRACVFTTTSSPSATGPVSVGYATHGTPSTSSRARPSWRSAIAVTTPRRRLSGTRLLEQRQSHLDHPLQVVDGDVLLRAVDVGHAVREVDAGEPAQVEDVRVGTAPGEGEGRRVAGPLERRAREANRRVVTLEPVAAVGTLHFRLQLAAGERRRKGGGVEHLLDDVGELRLVVR